MSRRCHIIGAVFCIACAAGSGGQQSSIDEFESEDWVRQARASAELLMLSDEERQAFEDRARLREHQRAQGLRVCEEGEHGTTWKEDCKVCQCERASVSLLGLGPR